MATRSLVKPAHSPSAADLAQHMLQRRAIEAAIWGMPIVSVDAMRRGFFGIGAKYGDIAYLSKPADWKLQITTPNSSSLYVYFNFNLKDGPIVLEFKPWVAFFRFYGPEPAIQNKTWVLNNIEETR